MRATLLLTGAIFVGASAATPACAEDGRWQVKLLATAVLADGKIAKVKKDLVGLPVGAQTKASDNFVPTLAVEYFISPQVSVETICCTTAHHVDGAGPLAGVRLVDDILIVPATVTFKYHLAAGPIRPYVGAGPAFFWVLDSKPGPGAAAIGATRTKLSSRFGAAVQAGADIPIGNKGLGLSLDVKKHFVSTTARFWAGNTEVLVTRHRLNPWLLSSGV